MIASQRIVEIEERLWVICDIGLKTEYKGLGDLESQLHVVYKRYRVFLSDSCIVSVYKALLSLKVEKSHTSEWL